MATIAVASAKGGCGKTTVSLLVGTELGFEGYKVALLDCDANQHATAFGLKAQIPGFVVYPDINEGNVVKTVRGAEEKNDVVIVDLPGGSSTLALKTLQMSNFVLIPSRLSLPDVKDALKMIAQIQDVEDLSKTSIARAMVWTMVSSGFESVAARHVRESVEKMDVPLFRSSIMVRAAYEGMHFSGRVPRQTDPRSAAATNVAAITNELLTYLHRMTEAA